MGDFGHSKMRSLVCLVFSQKGAGTKLTVKFPDVPVVRIDWLVR